MRERAAKVRSRGGFDEAPAADACRHAGLAGGKRPARTLDESGVRSNIPALAIFLALGLSVWTHSAGAETIDFEGLAAGAPVASVHGDGGSGPIGVSGTNPRFPASNAARIFDSSCSAGCAGGAPGAGPALGAPAITTGGGPGAEASGNVTEHGKVLVVSAAPAASAAAASAGWMTLKFDFNRLGSVTLSSIDVIDVEGAERDGIVALFGESGVLAMFPIPSTGDDGVATIGLGPTSGVTIMEVILDGPGAVDDVVFERDRFCGDGRQDPDEECDGRDAPACAGNCRRDCTCPQRDERSDSDSDSGAAERENRYSSRRGWMR